MEERTAPMVAVRGEATAEVAPDLARVAVTVTARDRDRARVLRDLDERARAVDAVLDGHASAIEHVESEALRVNPQIATNKPRERVSGYEGSFRRTVVLHDFEPLGDLLALLADNDLTSVAGPWWSLRPDSDAHRSVRVAAVHDAVQRAREYAGALGADLTDLVELADAALLSDAPAVPPSPAVASFRSAAAPETFTFDVSPTPQVVRATVEARFRITPPDLG